MKILDNTMAVLVETWEDPGDYPSGAGAGPLPSYDYFAGIEGEAKLEMTEEELTEWREFGEDWMDDYLAEFFLGEFSDITVTEWHVKLEAGTRVLVVEVIEAEAD